MIIQTFDDDETKYTEVAVYLRGQLIDTSILVAVLIDNGLINASQLEAIVRDDTIVAIHDDRGPCYKCGNYGPWVEHDYDCGEHE